MTALRLTNRFFLGFTMLVGSSFFVGIVPALAWVLPPLWLALIAIVVFDASSIWRLPQLNPSIKAIRAPELGQEFELAVTIPLPSGNFSGSVRVLAPAAPVLQFSAPEFAAEPGMETATPTLEASLAVKAVKLGYAQINAIPVLFRSRLGLWKRSPNCPMSKPYSFRVMPARETPPPQWMKETASSLAAMLGNRKVMRANEPDLFHSLRDYQYGDSRRFIDSKRWAKLGKPVTRTFEAEKRHQVVVALDLGQSMLGKVRDCDKLDYYLGLALVLLENALGSSDTAAFVAFSDQVHLTLPRIRVRGELEPLFRRDAALEALPRLTDFNLLAPALARVAPQRSIVVLLSDFSRPSQHAPIQEALRQLSRKHLVVAVSLQDRNQSVDQAILDRPAGPATDEEISRLLYSCWVEEQLTTFRTALGREGVAALSVRDDYWISAVTKVYGLLRESSRA